MSGRQVLFFFWAKFCHELSNLRAEAHKNTETAGGDARMQLAFLSRSIMFFHDDKIQQQQRPGAYIYVWFIAF